MSCNNQIIVCETGPYSIMVIIVQIIIVVQKSLEQYFKIVKCTKSTLMKTWKSIIEMSHFFLNDSSIFVFPSYAPA